ncbi:DUF6221 family protein [Streptomyces sp. NPDC102467]|uniref:DUF6221 family protein n=1 Tax=Streptomyces sp. NPDC102467 TaxID=3366179 RepID=UPI003824FF7E
MPSPTNLRVADTFERCEQLRRKARDATAKARQVRFEAVQIRLQAAQIRADLRRRHPQRHGENGVGEPARPSASPLGSTASAMRLAALVAFVRARLDEEATAADLFHEAGCTPADAPDHRRCRCSCRAPHRTLQDIAVRRTVARTSETTIREADHSAAAWPHNELAALLNLKALALRYELHGLWQEEWRP